MEKIISLFKRDYGKTWLVYNEVVPGADWVIAGEGVPTEKIDGTCCLVWDGKLYKRYDAKKGRQPPAGFEPAQPEPDPVTGHWPGWVAVDKDNPEDQAHWEAWIYLTSNFQVIPKDWTYELIGPKVQKNPYGRTSHWLIPHGSQTFTANPPRTFEGLKAWFAEHNVEGVVWWHPDGRKVKIKRKDFGLPWPVVEE